MSKKLITARIIPILILGAIGIVGSRFWIYSPDEGIEAAEKVTIQPAQEPEAKTPTPYDEALGHGMEAATAAQTATTEDDWNQVTIKWDLAILTLERSDSTNAPAKIDEYQVNRDYAYSQYQALVAERERQEELAKQQQLEAERRQQEELERQRQAELAQARQNCDPSYPDICIPKNSADLDCGDISDRRFTVLSPDPHRFDGDRDGIGCES